MIYKGFEQLLVGTLEALPHASFDHSPFKVINRVLFLQLRQGVEDGFLLAVQRGFLFPELRRVPVRQGAVVEDGLSALDGLKLCFQPLSLCSVINSRCQVP